MEGAHQKGYKFMGNVPAPAKGLGSNSNYYLAHLNPGNASDCNPVTDLSVIIEITEAIVAEYGFSIQLNGYSPPGADCNWQQYGFTFDPTNGPTPTLSYFINNWPTKGFDSQYTTGDLINSRGLLLTLPDFSPTLPAGYQLTVGLINDNNGNIIGVTFLVVDNQGKATSSQPISLTSLHVDENVPGAPPEPITSVALAPINAFELNIVGKINGQYTFIESGAGTITYVATSPLTVLNKQPSDTAAQGEFTEEEANIAYGPLPAGPSTSITQSFSESSTIPPTYKPGGPLAVSQQFGANQTNLYAIDRAGQLVVFYAQGGGHWAQRLALGPICLAHPGAAIAASQQFGANNQTDVFLIDQNGQLNVFWVEGTGDWNGPVKIGSSGIAHSGGPLAVSQQFGADNQTNVFLVDKHGTLNVFWVEGAGNWSAPVQIGPTGVAPKGAPVAASQQFGANQTDVFLVDTNGTLNVFWVQGAGAWNGPVKIGPAGHFPTGANVAVSQQFGVDQTDVFLVDKNGQLTVFWVQGTGNWSAPVKIGPSGFAVPGAPLAVSQQFGANNQTDVFLVDKTGQLNVFWVQGTGAWNGPVKIGPAGIAPSASISSKGAFVAASQQFGATNQTDLFVINQTGTNSPGWPTVFWVEGSNPWNGPGALATEV
jgi:hypothetical protein